MTPSDRRLKAFLAKVDEDNIVERIGGGEEIGAAMAEGAPALERMTMAVDDGAAADRAVRKLREGQPLDPRERFAVEAIILPRERPVVDIVGDDWGAVPAPWESFNAPAVHQVLMPKLRSIGRVEVPNHPSYPYAGTGFIVGNGILMTNRHVAEIFASGLGREGLKFLPGRTAGVDFKREIGSPEPGEILAVERVLMIHPYWDMALIAVPGLAGREVLKLSLDQPEDANNRPIAVVGYPAQSPYNDFTVQQTVFRGVYNVKRLQPGRVGVRRSVESYGKQVDAVTHDASTLGGNSGSAVIDVATGNVLALHFAGAYLDANFGVPSAELARDGRVIDAGVCFAGTPRRGPTAGDDAWTRADPVVEQRTPPYQPPDQPAAPGARPADTVQAVVQGPGGIAARVSIPINVEITVGVPQVLGAQPVAPPPAVPGPGEGATIERAVIPVTDTDYSTRTGYDPNFLGIEVPMPAVRAGVPVSAMADGRMAIPYHNFSIVQHSTRRLALLTASNEDARAQVKQPEPGRDYSRDGLGGLGDNDTEAWRDEPRIPSDHQIPDRFYTRDGGAFDRGHIVRREAVAWGTSYDAVRFANGDTFHVTNCSPQVKGFNRSNLRGLWGELENVVLEQAEGERLCVLAGPVLAESDRSFRGRGTDGEILVQIPRRYWKVIVARAGDALQAFGFVLEQDLGGVPLEFVIDAPWRQRLVSLSGIEEECGQLFTFAEVLHEADQAEEGAGQRVMERVAARTEAPAGRGGVEAPALLRSEAKAGIVFIHGISNHPAPEIVLGNWKSAIKAGGTDLDAAGADTRLLYWADVLYSAPSVVRELVGGTVAALEALAAEDVVLPEGGEEAERMASLVEAISRHTMTVRNGEVVREADAGTVQELPFVPDFIERFFMRHLVRDVHHYLYDVDHEPRPGTRYRVRQEIRRRLLAMLKDTVQPGRPNIIVSHSMGTVIAYDLLKDEPSCPSISGLITLGSPLGLDTVQERLPWTRQNGFPADRLDGPWFNIFDRLDIVAAADPEIANDMKRSGRKVVKDIAVHNDGSLHHELARYVATGEFQSALKELLEKTGARR
ncbi:DNA/RNA non-specific endonuclease [Acuticoccus sediminis]|uniref:DNA/RNA non-specific endonuclease n=1 Tax=Acuticoccus sediminis TaxID=2184697 RepID=UPI001CFD8CFD|nr:DNA/RNA non-specific endonuclease [Acuticoccus sediminis]